jgi:prephenate dehydrogenase
MMHISIIGMGLIGTSLGLALRAANAHTSPLGSVQVTGYDNHSGATRTARGRLAIDRQATTMAEAVSDAHLVVLATPVRAIQPILAQLASVLPAGTVVTDVASTKAQVCAWARALLPDTVDFVGGHPMAGREQAGGAAAAPELFQGAIYCLTPHPSARQHALDTVEALVTTVGARPYYIDPDEHDAYVAGVSHLPFLLSTILVEATGRSPGWKEMSLLAASGFRDISRLASGDVIMHRDICTTNQAALIRWINDTVSLLLDMREYLEQGDETRIEAVLAHAKQVRDDWLANHSGLRPGEGMLEQARQVERPSLTGLRRRPRPGHAHTDEE